MNNKTDIELTILMPCLNEAETVKTCVEKAMFFLKSNNVNGEVLIADNGSTDGSQELAQSAGAKVVQVPIRGYGAALQAGCEAALGKYVIMGDADDSYDFVPLMPFVERLRAGDELVMGNRFKGGIGKGAMPFLHKYFGNPVLSFLGRLFYPSKVGDFYCGLRGYNKESIQRLNLRSTGMVYAHEMVVQSSLHGLKISEVPIILHPDGRSRRPHLRTWSDGWKTLKFLLMYAPNSLFFVPGAVCTLLGLIATVLLLIYAPINIGNVSFDTNTTLYAGLLLVVGVNILSFGIITKVHAMQTQYIPTTRLTKLLGKITADSGTLVGGIEILLGLIAAIVAVNIWSDYEFGALDIRQMLRITMPSFLLIAIGLQTIFTSFVLDILRIESKVISIEETKDSSNESS